MKELDALKNRIPIVQKTKQEKAKLTVTDIENAFNSEKPLLKIITLKRRDNNEYRFIPVDELDLKEINTFIKIYRAKIIKNTIGQTKDHGYLLINETMVIQFYQPLLQSLKNKKITAEDYINAIENLKNI